MRNFFQSSLSFRSTSFFYLFDEADQEIDEVDSLEIQDPCVIQFLYLDKEAGKMYRLQHYNCYSSKDEPRSNVNAVEVN